jgi:hypothetical protein
MPKTIALYWNPLSPDNGEWWEPIIGLEGMAELTFPVKSEMRSRRAL